MPRLTRFEEYRDRYPDFALEKTDDGILLLRMHRDGGPAVWDSRTHHDIANLFNDVAGDRDVLATNISPANRIVIGPLLDRLISARGHIVIRVERGGATYRAIVLEDMDESMNVKAVFGPYHSR